MSGDKLDIRVSSWWKDNGQSPAPPTSPILTDLAAALATGIGGITSGHGGMAASDIQNSGIFLPRASSFLQTQPSTTGKPRAFLNWILFDEQFKFVTGDAVPVRNSEQFIPHILDGIEITKNGYLYVYVSNESSNINVFFDNLQVSHTSGPITEENHYYPYGLVMQGISSHALGLGKENKFKFNGKEEQRREFPDGGLDWIDFGARSYDAQTGRWASTDPLSDEMRRYSPYNYSFDNPIRFSDPDGMYPGEDPFSRMAGNYFSSVYGSRSGPVQERDMDESEKALNAFLAALDKAMGPVKDKIKTAQDILSGFVPFKDAVDEAIKGNWKAAAGYAVIDLAGGSLEKGVAKTVEKVAVKETEKAIEKTVVKEALSNSELVQKAANKAEKAVGGIGGVPGTAKHEYASDLLKRYQERFGNVGIEVKVPFNNGPGNRGFLDVIDYRNGIIYDFKFGSATMGKEQFLKYSRNYSNYLIQLIRPF